MRPRSGPYSAGQRSTVAPTFRYTSSAARIFAPRSAFAAAGTGVVSSTTPRCAPYTPVLERYVTRAAPPRLAAMRASVAPSGGNATTTCVSAVARSAMLSSSPARWSTSKPSARNDTARASLLTLATTASPRSRASRAIAAPA
jgi:hypothetical protein